MSNAPRLQFPSRAAGVRELRAQRLTTAEIAERLGCTPRQVYLADWSQRQTVAGPDIPLLVASSRVADLLPDDTEIRTRARKAAARRDIPLERLLRDLLVAAIEANLIDAVLDDADELRGCVA